MFRVAKWAVPVLALALLIGLTASRVTAEEQKAEKGTVTGKVLDKDGNPVADAPVRLFHAEKGAGKAPAAAEKKKEARQDETPREPKADDADCKSGDGKQERRTGATKWRPVRERQRHHHGADRGCRPEDAEPLRADVQYLVGEYRQERLSPSKEHREQIERERADQDGL